MSPSPITCMNERCIQPKQVLGYRTGGYGSDDEYFCSIVCYNEFYHKEEPSDGST